MKTCTEIQARRSNVLIPQWIQFPEHLGFLLNEIGFWSSTLNEFWGMARDTEWNTDTCGE